MIHKYKNNVCVRGADAWAEAQQKHNTVILQKQAGMPPGGWGGERSLREEKP